MNIAILDDDTTQLNLIKTIFSRSQFFCDISACIHTFSSGVELFKKMQAMNFDLLLLDRQVPDLSGDEILAWIRQNAPLNTIVIMITSLADPNQIAKILSLGADDYVTKPFHPEELLARSVRFLTKNGIQASPKSETEFTLHGLDFDRVNLTISRGKEVILCSAGEFSLTEYLFRNAGQPLSRKRIFEAVWQRRSVESSRALDTQIHRVRSKLGLLIENGFILQPIYGVGYRLDIVGETVEQP